MNEFSLEFSRQFVFCCLELHYIISLSERRPMDIVLDQMHGLGYSVDPRHLRDVGGAAE